MTITADVNGLRCELERMCRLFYPDESIRFIERDAQRDSLHAQIDIINNENKEIIPATVYYKDNAFSAERTGGGGLNPKERDLIIADTLYEPLVKLSGYTPPWGLLTGVRPVKLLRMLRETSGADATRERFLNKFHCAVDKYELCAQTEEYERPILESSCPKSFSLYISIPFCPTRCSYCSFVSQSVDRAGKLIPEYVELLVRELEETASLAGRLGLRLETVYMGGGTPTTLSPGQLAMVLGAVNRYFDMSTVREFTVEAGRPDTVTPEKLSAIKNAGVERISVNPQTLSDRVLQCIGRRHTAKQVYEAMDMARACGFGNINMDLIAGLPGDDIDTFSATVEGVLSMHPENITVHTLSMKKASDLVTSGMAENDAVGDTVGRMLRQCTCLLPKKGYHPYYLYRQTRMLGNMENVGWAKEGLDGLYNVYIMDETHTILAAGAGGVTKLRQPLVNNIERIYNYKFPYEYIKGFNEMLERKKGVIEFYEKFC